MRSPGARSSSSTSAGMALRPAGPKIVSRSDEVATSAMRPSSPGRMPRGHREHARLPTLHADHQAALIGPVRDHAGHRARRVGERLREQQGAHGGAGAVRRSDVQHERRDRDAVADERDRPRRPQPPEHAVAEQDVASSDLAHPWTARPTRRARRPEEEQAERHGLGSPSRPAGPTPGSAGARRRDALRLVPAVRREPDLPEGDDVERRSRPVADSRRPHGAGGRAPDQRVVHRRRGRRLAGSMSTRTSSGAENSSSTRRARVVRPRDGPCRPGPAAGDGTGRCRTGSRAAGRARRRRAAPRRSSSSMRRRVG